MYNGTDHFSILPLDILLEHLLEARQVLEMALNGATLPPGWTVLEGMGSASPFLPTTFSNTLPKAVFLVAPLMRSNPVINLLCPTPPTVASLLKLRALAAVRSYFHSPFFFSSPPAPQPQRPRRGRRINYRSHLDFKAMLNLWIPTVTPLKPPGAQLLDPTA